MLGILADDFLADQILAYLEQLSNQKANFKRGIGGVIMQKSLFSRYFRLFFFEFDSFVDKF